MYINKSIPIGKSLGTDIHTYIHIQSYTNVYTHSHINSRRAMIFCTSNNWQNIFVGRLIRILFAIPGLFSTLQLCRVPFVRSFVLSFFTVFFFSLSLWFFRFFSFVSSNLPFIQHEILFLYIDVCLFGRLLLSSLLLPSPSSPFLLFFFSACVCKSQIQLVWAELYLFQSIWVRVTWRPNAINKS